MSSSNIPTENLAEISAKAPVRAKIFMLDNLDSFTYNLVDELQCLGFEPVINSIKQPALLGSPGPGESTNNAKRR